MLHILVCLLLGFTVGGVSGLLGIGGGVILVPALMWMFDLKQTEAAGITLAILVLPIGLPAVWRYYLDGHLRLENIESAAYIAVAFAAGTYAGAAGVSLVSLHVLRLAFGLLLIYIAVRFLLASDSEVASAAVGLGAVGIAWSTYLGLRLLGRKHLRRPSLGKHIRAMAQQGKEDPDYYI